MQNKEALNSLNNIKTMMERSSKFLSLSGLAGVFAGIYAILGAVSAYFILDWGNARFNFERGKMYAQDNYLMWLVVDGLLVLTLSILTAWYFTNKKAKRLGLKMWDKAAKRMFQSFIAPLIAGGLFCFILLVKYNLVALVAPITLLFYGLALVNASKYSFDELKYLGFCQIALGLISTLILGYGLYFWTVGFGLLHIVYGVMMYKKHQ